MKKAMPRRPPVKHMPRRPVAMVVPEVKAKPRPKVAKVAMPAEAGLEWIR